MEIKKVVVENNFMRLNMDWRELAGSYHPRYPGPSVVYQYHPHVNEWRLYNRGYTKNIKPTLSEKDVTIIMMSEHVEQALIDGVYTEELYQEWLKEYHTAFGQKPARPGLSY